jgi:hypothetical protein
MDTTKYHRLRTDCHGAIQKDNLEQCCSLIMESLDERAVVFNEVLAISSRLQGLLSENNMGTLSFDEYSKHRALVRKSLITFLDNTLKPEDVSLLRRIHEKILVIKCKKSPTIWKDLFPDAFFSHVHIMNYGDELPATFLSPDVIVFDDLECPGIGNTAQIRLLCRQMPDANWLYFGLENPFKENEVDGDKDLFDRFANANSKFTIHARLRELLEFRKIYGPLNL